MSHFLCDFALQNDFVAKFKSRLVDGKYNPMWFWVLLAHCSIHAIPVLILTGSGFLALAMLISHFIIDFNKCEGKLTFNGDQISHLLVIFAIWSLFVIYF